MTVHLFVIPPPWSDVLEVLKMLKVPLDQEFKKSELATDSETLEEIALLLSPYYKPYYRRKHLYNIDSSNILNILRQILLSHSYVVSGRDTTKSKRHIKLYKIIPLKESDTLPSEIIISFN
jgi:hypothetical protein